MKSQLVMMRYCRKEVDVCLNARVSKSTTPFSLMKVARLVRGIFKPLRASGAAGAAIHPSLSAIRHGKGRDKFGFFLINLVNSYIFFNFKIA